MTPSDAATMSATVDADGGEPELPASVSPSGAEPAQAAAFSVGPPRVSASSLTCNYLDQGTKSNLAESACDAAQARALRRSGVTPPPRAPLAGLLLAASHAAVLDTHAKPFSSPTDSAHAMFKARLL